MNKNHTKKQTEKKMRKDIIKTIETKSHWLYAAILLLLLPLLASCDKAPINSKIEGHWQLERFTILETNETTPCERIYWGITRAGAKLFEKQGPHGYAMLDALIEYRENQTIFVLKDIRLGDGKTMPTPAQLHPYGLNNADASIFDVVKSTHKQMILQSDYARLEFKKF